MKSHTLVPVVAVFIIVLVIAVQEVQLVNSVGRRFGRSLHKKYSHGRTLKRQVPLYRRKQAFPQIEDEMYEASPLISGWVSYGKVHKVKWHNLIKSQEPTMGSRQSIAQKYHEVYLSNQKYWMSIGTLSDQHSNHLIDVMELKGLPVVSCQTDVTFTRLHDYDYHFFS